MNKYNAQRVEAHGLKFDSKMEARRYEQLLLLEQAGEIRNIMFHPTYLLQPHFRRFGKFVRAVTYEADFAYEERVGDDAWPIVIEDVKGHETPVFRLKLRLFWYNYPGHDLRIITDV